MDNELIEHLSVSEIAISQYLETQGSNSSMHSFFQYHADQIPSALEFIQKRICSMPGDFESKAKILAILESSALFAVSSA